MAAETLPYYEFRIGERWIRISVEDYHIIPKESVVENTIEFIAKPISNGFKFMAKPISNGFNSEKAFQAACHEWVWNHMDEDGRFDWLPLRRTFFHVPNEMDADPIKINLAKGRGLVPGIPDNIFLTPLMGIELKQPGKDQGANQIKVQEAWGKAGLKYYLVEYMEDFRAIVTREVEKVKWW